MRTVSTKAQTEAPQAHPATATATTAPITTTRSSSTADIDHLSSLLHNASLTNSELFGAILSAIKGSKSTLGTDSISKNWIHNSEQGYDAISSIVHGAAVGADGCVTDEDWIRRFSDAYNAFQSSKGEARGRESISGEDGVSRSLGSIVRDMPTDGHALRLRVALEVIDAATHNVDTDTSNSSGDAKNIMTVRQAVRMLRGTALVGNVELQSRALNCLVRIVPRLASHPLEILAMVQTPTLRLLDWKCLEEMGSFTYMSDSQRRCFRAMINYGKLEEDADDKKYGSNNTNRYGNQKRKRPWEDSDTMEQNIDSSKEDTAVMLRLVEAAHLARRGDQRGAKHGAVLCIPADDSISMDTISIQSPIGLQRVIGRGWNHNVLLDSSKSKNKLVLHSEVHAAADAIRRFGEDVCFERLFPRATVLIVELVDSCAYEKCHPCPKCNTFLRAVGITRAIHSTPNGTIDETDMSPANPELLARDVARVPFCAACTEMQIHCKQLEETTKVGSGI